MTGPTEGTCVEQPHAHVGQCYRRGLADGYAQGLAARLADAAATDTSADHEGWKPGDPCGSCGSTETHGPIPGCRTCGASDTDE